jgi:hypothetical protein
MSKTKLKGCRPFEEINKEYSSVCGLLGDNFHRGQMLKLRFDAEADKLKTRLRELDLEAAEANKQEQEAKAEQEPASQEDASVAAEATT